MKRKYAKIAIALAVAAATATTPVVSVLASEEAVVTSGEAIDGAMVTSGEEKLTSDAVATLEVNFTDEFGNTLGIEPAVATKTGPEGETAVFKYGEDWQIPEGYTFASANDESWAKQDLRVQYGQTLDTLTIAIVKQSTTKTVNVKYVTEDGTEVAEGAPVTVDADANNVNTSALTDIPEGYELASVGDVAIEDGVIKVTIRKIVTTKEIGVNYWDVENNVQAGEGKVTVDVDAYNVNTSALTDIPEGYELTRVGDIQIIDGWIYVEVKKAATTKEVGVNYYIEEEDRYVEGTVTVAADAIHVNTSALTDVPAGYEVIWTGDVLINDGWIWVELRKSETVKEVGVNYYIPAEDRHVEGKVIVDKDANNVNTSALTDIPAGYEPIWVGDVQINDGWIYVELRVVETGVAATLQVNFVGAFGEPLDVAPVIATKTGTEGEWAAFNYGVDWQLPEGYTFAADFDENIAKQILRVKYGDTLDTLTIGIVETNQLTTADFSDGI